MTNKNIVNVVFILLMVFLIGGCKQKNKAVSAPQKLTRSTTCARDGMILMDHAGPKAQIVWKNGTHTFYCEAREAFGSWFNPIEKERITELYVQDMGQVSWGAYEDRWIKSKDAYFVIDSEKQGAMGLSYVSFSDRDDAISFQKQFSGKVVVLDGITQDVYDDSTDLIRQQMLSKQMMKVR